MKKTAAPSSASGRGRGSRAADRRPPAGAREWLGGIRFSGFAAIMLGLVVLAVAVLAPTVATYVDQRQKIAALQESVQVTREQVAELERERERWDDPVYITTQARERLYYGKPGEISFIVVDDLEETEAAREPEPVGAEVEESPADWMSQLLRSVVAAGTAKNAVEEVTVGVPDPPMVTETPAP